MKQRVLYFTAPRQVAVQEQELPALQAGQVLVETLVSAISPGTEMLLYRGQFPTDLALDDTIDALVEPGVYPLRYGYSCVGRVIALGERAASEWEGRMVFSFQPHASHFVAQTEALMPVPQGLTAEQAAFLPNMETAVNLVMDGAPLIGEDVVVFGQGIVGLLTVSLLARFPLARLITLDCYPLRRQASLAAGATASLDPHSMEDLEALHNLLPNGADLVYELSGNPATLDQAISCAGFAGRVVIGSWYGKQRASLDLGGRFHRSRIQLISSQVSTVAPRLSGRWTKARRFELAWDLLAEVQPTRWITQRFPLTEAAQAYRLLDENPEQTIQVMLTYP